jgi:hypothetical protein
MKESERIKTEMMNDTSDNDFRAANYLHKIERAKRKELFEDTLLQGLKLKYDVIEIDNRFEIITEKYGRLIYYPKANSLLISRDNVWIKRFGDKWLNKYLI